MEAAAAEQGEQQEARQLEEENGDAPWRRNRRRAREDGAIEAMPSGVLVYHESGRERNGAELRYRTPERGARQKVPKCNRCMVTEQANAHAEELVYYLSGRLRRFEDREYQLQCWEARLSNMQCKCDAEVTQAHIRMRTMAAQKKWLEDYVAQLENQVFKPLQDSSTQTDTEEYVEA